jgi:hypothetical protein
LLPWRATPSPLLPRLTILNPSFATSRHHLLHVMVLCNVDLVGDLCFPQWPHKIREFRRYKYIRINLKLLLGFFSDGGGRVGDIIIVHLSNLMT